MHEEGDSPAVDGRDSSARFYDRLSGVYDLLADASEHHAREAGERALAAQPGERVLEIGFGTGNALVDLAAAVGATGRVFGIDISTGMLGVARGKLEAAGLAERVQLEQGDARQLPYGDGSFDAAFASFALELFAAEEVPVVLGEVRRVLRPGGRFAVVALSTPAPGESPSLLERAYVWMHRHFPHIVDCQPIELNAMLEASGFHLRDTVTLAIWTIPVTVTVAVR